MWKCGGSLALGLNETGKFGVRDTEKRQTDSASFCCPIVHAAVIFEWLSVPTDQRLMRHRHAHTYKLPSHQRDHETGVIYHFQAKGFHSFQLNEGQICGQRLKYHTLILMERLQKVRMWHFLLKQPTGFTIDCFKCITLLKWNGLILIYLTTKRIAIYQHSSKRLVFVMDSKDGCLNKCIY